MQKVKRKRKKIDVESLSLANRTPKEEPAMPVVNVHQAKTHLSRLLAQVEQGEEVVIARNGKPVARLVRLQCQGKPQFGSWKGRIALDDSFFDPLPEEELSACEV